MAERFISPGFKGRASATVRALKKRIPPGQFETEEFPILSAGPTPRVSLERWDFSIYGDITEDLKWTWEEFLKLPRETVTVDITASQSGQSSTRSGQEFRSTRCSTTLHWTRSRTWVT